MRHTFTFYADPGHAWLKVSRKELEELGVADQISHYSYERGDFVYLEEDQDAAIFLDACKARFPGFAEKLRFKESHTNNSSRIRNYLSYCPSNLARMY